MRPTWTSIWFWVPAGILLGIWTIASGFFLETLPGPRQVLDAAARLLSDSGFYVQFGGTILRTLGCFLASAVLGVFLALLPGARGALRDGYDSLVDFLRSIPAPALLPLLMSLFGLYQGPKLALAILVCTLLNIVYTGYGIRQEARSPRAELARHFGGSRWFVFTRVIIPGSLENILGGLRVTLSLSLVLVTLASMFLMTGTGAGVMIRLAYEDRHHDEMYALILILGLIGFALNRSFLRIEKWMLRHG